MVPLLRLQPILLWLLGFVTGGERMVERVWDSEPLCPDVVVPEGAQSPDVVMAGFVTTPSP